MTKPFSDWTVLPHGKLERIDDNILCVTGTLEMPLGEYTRRMTVVRLRDARLVIYSAIALDDVEMKTLEQLGPPAFLIVPNNLHRLDAKVWKDRYPSMRVITPSGALPKVKDVVAVDATEVDFGDPAVKFVAVPGTGELDSALVIEGRSGTTLVLNDLIFDIENRPGFSGWLFKLLGLTGDAPHIPAPVRMREVKDKLALATQLRAWAAVPNLKRIIISHGKIVVDDPRGVLERVAHELQH
jgi:hypothetical protein